MSSHQTFFKYYQAEKGFDYNPHITPDKEFERLASLMKWIGKPIYNKKYEQCFEKKIQSKVQKPGSKPIEYFLNFEKFEGFTHKPQNQPLFEFLRLAKHMNWVGPTLTLNKQAFNKAVGNRMFHETNEAVYDINGSNMEECEIENQTILINPIEISFISPIQSPTKNSFPKEISSPTMPNILNDLKIPYIYPTQNSLANSCKHPLYFTINSDSNILNNPMTDNLDDPTVHLLKFPRQLQKANAEINHTAEISMNRQNISTLEIQNTISKTQNEVSQDLCASKNNKTINISQPKNQKRQKFNPKHPLEFFGHFEKYMRFPFNKNNDYMEEFERMVKYFKWGDVQSTIHREQLIKCIIDTNASPNQVGSKIKTDYFKSYARYNGFNHKKNNDPFVEFENLAKHMKWDFFNYENHRRIFLNSLKSINLNNEIQNIDKIQKINFESIMTTTNLTANKEKNIIQNELELESKEKSIEFDKDARTFNQNKVDEDIILYEEKNNSLSGSMNKQPIKMRKLNPLAQAFKYENPKNNQNEKFELESKQISIEFDKDVRIFNKNKEGEEIILSHKKGEEINNKLTKMKKNKFDPSTQLFILPNEYENQIQAIKHKENERHYPVNKQRQRPLEFEKDVKKTNKEIEFSESEEEKKVNLNKEKSNEVFSDSSDEEKKNNFRDESIDMDGEDELFHGNKK